MSKISNQLTELVNQKKQLATNLNVKGVSGDESETLNTLVPKVLSIVGGGDVKLGYKQITEDGEYYAYDDGLDGYSSINVNVANGANSFITFGELSGAIRYRNIKHIGNIPSYAYYGETQMKEIELINCESIESYALNNCENLTNIINNKIIKSLGVYALNGCSALNDEIVLDDSIEEVPNYCFNNCSMIKLNLPKNLKIVGDRAFNNCRNIIATELPLGLAEVKSYGFYYCENVTAEICPVMIIGTYAFSYSGVKFNEIPRGCTLGIYAFLRCPNITNIKIDIAGSIPNYCFRYNTNMESIELGDAITTINSYAFGNNTKLKTIICHSLTPPTIASNSFYAVSPNVIKVPASVLETYKKATNWTKWADIMEGIEGE